MNQLASLQELVRDMNARRRAGADHPRRQSCLRRAGRSAVREGAGQGAVPRASLAVLRRDLAALPLAHPRHALPRDLGRRARPRRHGLDHPAAHRAALQRPLRPRSPRRPDRRSRSDALPNRPRLLVQPRAPPKTPGANGSTTASSPNTALPTRAGAAAAPPPPTGQPPTGNRASSSSSATIPPSTTAASPTTAGCRSCRSRRRRSPGTTC